jgi:hypothetical protein
MDPNKRLARVPGPPSRHQGNYSWSDTTSNKKTLIKAIGLLTRGIKFKSRLKTYATEYEIVDTRVAVSIRRDMELAMRGAMQSTLLRFVV